MRVLVTNYTLGTRTGTELFVRDLALGLLAAGHEPIVYSPHLGPLAEELQGDTIPVIDDLRKLTIPPDLIHGHHVHETMTAMLHFPQVPAIFVVHDWHSWHDTPPRMPQVRRYVAIDRTRWDRLISQDGIPAERVQIIPNSVDTRRFQLRSELPARPRRGLIYSNYVTSPGDYLQVREACAHHGVELEAVGSGVHNATAEPHRVLAGYDLVFGLGRSAMEAMATGTGVIIWGLEGLGGLVSRSNFDRLLAHNFGRRALRKTTAAEISAEIGRFSKEEATWVGDQVRKNHNLDQMLAAYLSLYEEVIAEARAHPVSMATTVEAASAYLAGCVPRAEVDWLLGKRGMKSGRRIKKLADAMAILSVLAIIQMAYALFQLLGPRHAPLKVLLVAAFCALGVCALFLRSRLRARAGVLGRNGWRYLLPF